MTGANGVLLRGTWRSKHVGGLQTGPLESRTQLVEPVQFGEEVGVPLLGAQLQSANGAHLGNSTAGSCRLQPTDQAQSAGNCSQTRHAQAGQGRVVGGVVVRQRMGMGHVVVRRHRRGHRRCPHMVAHVVMAMGVRMGQRMRVRVGVRVGVMVRRGGGQVAGHRNGNAAGRRADGGIAVGAGGGRGAGRRRGSGQCLVALPRIMQICVGGKRRRHR